MRKMILILMSSVLSLSTFASPAVQRTPNSSYEEYLNYLKSSGHVSFVDAYIELSSLAELETPLLEKCLEEVYLGAPASETCFAAVKSLSSRPLNQARREVLFSFLSKLERIKSPQKNFYQGLQLGLLETHPNLAEKFHSTLSAKKEKTDRIQELEMKAWKKALFKKFPSQEMALLINGKKVSHLEKWTAPHGIYQWSLITNTHAPLIRLGTFSQFAAESLKSLTALADSNCQDLNHLDAQKFGLLQVEVFSNKKCVAQFGFSTPIAGSEHLGSSAAIVQMESSSNRHWIWPAMVLLGVGLASSLRNKQVSVQMPSFR